MAFAAVGPAHHGETAMHQGMKADAHGAGHHNAGHEQPSVPDMPDAPPSCYGVGCFIVLDSRAPVSPSAGVLAVATLSPALAEAMIPAWLDPSVPPPRIQV